MMSKAIKIWLVVAACLVILGTAMFSIGMIGNMWDFSKLDTRIFENNTYIPAVEFTDIVIDTKTANVTVLPSEDGQVKIECYEPEKEKHTVTIENNTLSIRVNNEKPRIVNIGIHIKIPSITVYLPAAAYGALTVRNDTGNVTVPKDFSFKSIDVSADTGNTTVSASTTEFIKINLTTGEATVSDLSAASVTIKVSTGAILVENVNTGDLALTSSTGQQTVKNVICTGDVITQVSTGKTVMTDVTCQNLDSTGDTGALNLKNVVANEAFSIERSTGDVRFDSCDAAQLTVNTDTGDVTGTLRTAKIFDCHTDTGREQHPETTTGGKCKITSDTGDIIIRIVD